MKFALLLAGGNGTRLGLPTPKQFLLLGGKTILEHTVEKFLVSPEIDFTVIVVPEVWFAHSCDLLSKLESEKIGVCVGGDTRQESLFKGCVWLQEKFGSNATDIVVSHDVARPFVSLDMIAENIRVCEKFGAADTVLPTSDTIVKSMDHSTVTTVPDRSVMYLGQTPQTFYLDKFVSIYRTLEPEYLSRVTDAARILVDNGVKVGLVFGDVSNIKITTLFDYNIANAIINNR